MENPFRNGGFKHLVPGKDFAVVKEFTDYDGRVHPVGERWTFHRASFVPYYDGLTLYVQPETGSEWGIRLEWASYGQGKVVDELETYVMVAGGTGDTDQPHGGRTGADVS